MDPILKRYVRDKLPLQILRGNYTTEPGKLTSSAPPIDSQNIRSGMVIVKAVGTIKGVASQTGFRPSDADDQAGLNTSFYIAMHDQDSPDVIASGVMVGLDCADDYELQSGYFDPNETWTLDMPLTCGEGGIIIEAQADKPIIGYISKIGTGAGNAIPYVGKTPSTSAANSLVIQFKTARNGQRTPA